MGDSSSSDAGGSSTRMKMGPWVGILLAIGVGMYFYFTCASHSKQHEEEYQRVIHAYEEAIFHKKVEVYKQEFKQKYALWVLVFYARIHPFSKKTSCSLTFPTFSFFLVEKKIFTGRCSFARS